MHPRALALVGVLLAAGALSLNTGCGGGGEAGEKGGGEAAAQQAATQIPAADRAAYYQLAISSGLLRSALVARSIGQPPPARAGAAEQRRFAATVRRTHPLDHGLRSIRKAELAMFARVTPTNGLSAARARAELRRLDRINASISRFLRREPAGAALVPD